MNKQELTELMHAVLDDEATAGERRALERELAADPAARARFDELRELFDGLERIPKAYPPEGLVAWVMANVNIRQTGASRGRFDQLFGWSRIIGLTAKEDRGISPGKWATVPSDNEHGPIFRGEHMSEKMSGSISKRKVLIGAGIAVAAAVVTTSFLLDSSTTGKESVGTIVPAQRYRADQPSASDVKAGGTTSTVPVTATTDPQPAAGNGSQNAGRSSDNAGRNSDNAGRNSDNAGRNSDNAGRNSDNAGRNSDNAGRSSDNAGRSSDNAGRSSDNAGRSSDNAGRSSASSGR